MPFFTALISFPFSRLSQTPRFGLGSFVLPMFIELGDCALAAAPPVCFARVALGLGECGVAEGCLDLMRGAFRISHETP